MTSSEPPPIKVLYVSHVGFLGGAERSLLDLIHALDRKRYDVRVVLPNAGEFSDRLQSIGVPCDLCPSLARLQRTSSLLRKGRQAFSVLAGALALRSITKRYSPSIVHTNSTTAALYALCLPARSRPPTLWHFRDLVLPAGIGPFLASRCSRIIVPSSCCRDLVSDIAAFDKIVTIPNGIELTSGHDGGRPTDQAKANDDRILITMIGQLAEWKGHTTAIEVARRVIAQCSNVNFLIVADARLGATSITISQLTETVRAYGLTDHVTINPSTDEIGAILARADILLHPAFPEPFGRVIIEAMAAECAVVACAGAHGPGEIVRHEIEGLLVASHSADDLADAVVRLVKNPMLRQRMGRLARARVVAEFHRGLMAQRMQSLYESITFDQARP
jgi:glycosyltransferase involved in cell wall biosynthesis